MVALALAAFGFGIYSLLGADGNPDENWDGEGPASAAVTKRGSEAPIIENASEWVSGTGVSGTGVVIEEKIRAETGSIHGSVRLGAELRGKITACTVTVREAVNRNALWQGKPKPKQMAKVLHFAEGQDRVHFNFEKLPFSEFGWTTYAYAPGVNGSRQFVILKEDDAVKRVILSLSGGALVTFAVKDQQFLPVADVQVRLVPSGDDILGRPAYGPFKSDVVGSILITDVIRGEYDLVVGERRNPIVPIRKVNIRKGGHQFIKVAMKRGGTVRCHVSLPGGYGAKGVKVEAVALSPVYHKYEDTTDHRGVLELEHLPKGKYHFHFSKKGYQRGFKKVTVPADGVVDVQVSLVWQR